jgi:hypothetical protein
MLVLLGVAVLSYLTTAAIQAATPEPDADGWITIFDGKTLDGWKANEQPKNWTVEDECIVGRGERSHLFYTEAGELSDLEFQVEVKLNKAGNSGMYFRAKFEEGWPTGYEAQVENSSPDPRKTGSLYRFEDIKEQLIEDDTWWTQHVICKGNHITIKVNDKVVVDYEDKENTYKKGFIALQQHDPGSVVHYRNLKIKKLDE